MRKHYLAKSTVAVPGFPMESQRPYGTHKIHRFSPAYWAVYFWMDTEYPLYHLVGPALTKDGRPRADGFGFEVELEIPPSEVPPEVRRDLARAMEDQLDAYIEERQEEIASVLQDLD